MRSITKSRILGITQATGWSACYNGADGKVFSEPLSVWAVVEEDGETFVTGFTGDGTPADQPRSFFTYCRDDRLGEILKQEVV